MVRCPATKPSSSPSSRGRSVDKACRTPSHSTHQFVFASRGALSLPLPACGGETSEARSWWVGVRGSLRRAGLAESPPHPALCADLSPQAGRGILKQQRVNQFVFATHGALSLPSPLWGGVGGGGPHGRSRCGTPPPQPSPTRGEGEVSIRRRGARYSEAAASKSIRLRHARCSFFPSPPAGEGA